MPDSALSSPAAFVRSPSPRLADGLVTHIERSNNVDAELALQQWHNYVGALQSAGYATRKMQAAPDLPDGVFVEDAMIAAGNTMIITAPSAPSRAPEVSTARAAAEAAGLEVVELAHAPGITDIKLDGGDVLKVGKTAYVGLGGRTTEGGAQALDYHLRPLGYRVVPVPIRKTLHLKSQVTALPDGTIIGYLPLVDNAGFWPDFLAVPEEEGAHVVPLGANRVLMSDKAPRSAELFAQRGLDVVTVAIDEFAKLEGCVTCLSVRLHDAD